MGRDTRAPVLRDLLTLASVILQQAWCPLPDTPKTNQYSIGKPEHISDALHDGPDISSLPNKLGLYIPFHQWDPEAEEA